MRIIVLIICLLLLDACNLNAQQVKPNVLFIIDHLNDYLGFNGYSQVKTSNMNRLSASGVRFLNTHSNTRGFMSSRNNLSREVYTPKPKDFGWTALKDQATLKNNKTIMKLFYENGYYVMVSCNNIQNECVEELKSYSPKLFFNNSDTKWKGRDRTLILLGVG